MPSEPSPEPQANPVPLLIYGAAFKEGRTAELVQEALENGFTGLDSANYPTAYDEPLTGDGIEASLKTGIKREDLFVRKLLASSRGDTVVVEII